MVDERSKSSFIPFRKGLRAINWKYVLNEGFNDFLKTKNWLYDFSEARYLSQMFFKSLIEAIDNSYSMQVTDDRYTYINKNNQEWLIHFDVMNNPNECHNFAKGIKESNEEGWNEWYKYYHSIGNLTPIPWPKLGRAANNLQGIHKRLGERWDKLLQYCADNWDLWIQEDIYCKDSSFTIYMKLTCQVVYYQGVYDSFIEKFGDCVIGEIEDNKLLEWYDTVKDFDGKILSFEDKSDNIKHINRLISLRGKLMMALIIRNINKICKSGSTALS